METEMSQPIATPFINQIADEEIRSVLSRIYHDFEYLNFFRDYGACCFAITHLLCFALKKKGYQVRPIACIDQINEKHRRFLLGVPGFAKPGQVEGHVVCLLEERYLIDFGLGNVRRYFDHDFVQAIAIECNPSATVYAELNIENKQHMTWEASTRDDAFESVMEREAAQLKLSMNRYIQYRKNRIGYSIRSHQKEHNPAMAKMLNHTLPLLGVTALFSETLPY
jgi:hypothetical protein